MHLLIKLKNLSYASSFLQYSELNFLSALEVEYLQIKLNSHLISSRVSTTGIMRIEDLELLICHLSFFFCFKS